MLNFVAGSLTHVVGGWVGGYLFERIHFPSVETRHRGCGSKIQVFPRFGHLFTLIAGALITNMG